MTFASPAWLLALLLIPALAGAYVASRSRANRYAVRFTAVDNLVLAAGTVPAWRRHLPAALALAAAAVLALALAKPQTTVAVPIQRASVMLVTDHSRSMLADDVRPTRLAAAQRAALTFIDELPGPVRLGAVAYADTPDSVQAPSSDRADTRRVIEGQVADGATATGEALQAAVDALRQDRQNGKRPPSAVVLLSDGQTTSGRDPVEVARAAGRLKIAVHTVALGTSDATVPNADPFGPPISVAPDPETLARISEASGGRAFAATDQDRLSSIYKSLGSQLGTRRESREITAAFAAAGVVLLLAAGVVSLRSAGRLP
jgi:Ca-activated chloride channel family protein